MKNRREFLSWKWEINEHEMFKLYIKKSSAPETINCKFERLISYERFIDKKIHYIQDIKRIFSLVPASVET